MVASTSVPLNTKQHKAFIAYYENIQNNQATIRSERRARFEQIDRDYQREVDKSQEDLDAKRANRAGDPNRYQNITVPVVMPQVEAAVVHQTSVFLTGEPMFGVVADPRFIDEAVQIESVLEDQAVRGSWQRELIMFFRDAAKFDFAPLEVSWTQEVTYTVETSLSESITEGIPEEVIWTGNKLRRLDPYNTFVDPSVTPSEVYKGGEYGGYTEFKSRIGLKSFIATLPDKIIANIVPAFNSGLESQIGASSSQARNYYIPRINPGVSTDTDVTARGTNWLKWAGIGDESPPRIEYKDGYEVTTLYCKILPSEFGLKVPNSNTPQIYKLIIVNHQWIIYAEKQTNAHAYLPIMIGKPNEDGLAYQTKSLAENSAPFQAVTTAYMSSILASRRRAISDRLLYDPSRITSAAINSSNPSAKIPVRPAAYGKNISDAVHHFEYREDQQGASMQQIQTLIGLSNTLVGQNQASQGQFVKGNKTLHEFESVMQNANGRDQLASIMLEYQVFIPIKQILKLNILQFQGGTTVYNRDKEVTVEVDPVALRRAVLEFRVSDGLIPSSKLLNSESFATALQVFGSSPQIAGAYNVGQLFSYFMKTQGAKISEFEKSPEQQAFEQAMGEWQQIAALAIEKAGEVAPNIPPQPLPAQFNYDPTANKPSPAGSARDSGAATNSQTGNQ